jgi:hypothetical protein
MTKLPWQAYRAVDDETFYADLEHKVATGEWTEQHATMTVAMDRLMARGARRIVVNTEHPDGSITVSGVVDGIERTITIHASRSDGDDRSDL